MIKDNPFGIKVYTKITHKFLSDISFRDFLKNSINKHTYFNTNYYNRWINSCRYGFKLKKERE
jgi:hypothetical protein